MVRCNLSVLLAERNLKITKVCKDTGISRTTLTYLVNNYSKGVQYDTLNTLCTYLQIHPGELISFVPVDIHIGYVHRNNEELDIELEISYKGKTMTTGLIGSLHYYYQDSDDPYFFQEQNRHKPCGVDVYVEAWDEVTNPLFKKEIEFTIEAFQALPISFLKDIENEIIGDLVNDIDYEYNLDTLPDEIAVSFSWVSYLQKNNLTEPPTVE